MNWKEKFPKENIYYENDVGLLFNNDVLKQLKEIPDESIDCVITSPPYYNLRDYGIKGQIGIEENFKLYLNKLLEIFKEVKRILKNEGTCWVNLGDSYVNKKCEYIECDKKKIIPKKSLYMIPERFAIKMIEMGWILRNQIIWEKPNAMPNNVKDRFTVDFEKIFFFTKNQKYYFKQIKEENKDKYQGKRGKVIKRQKLQSAMRSEGFQDYYGKGRNKRTVWKINTKPFKDAHFAVFPPDIPKICITAGCPENGIVLDIFMGSGTTALSAEELNRKWIGIELNTEYCELIKQRIEKYKSPTDNLF